jgi:hypothetical protein
VAPRGNGRWQATALVIVVALIGLVAGATTRLVLSVSAGARVLNQLPAATPTATLLVAIPSPTLTQEPTTFPVGAHFSIRLTITPSSGPAGANITIAAHVTDNATGAPLPSLTCHLRAPSNDGPMLFSTWPAPVASDNAGVATWNTSIPQVAPGRYVVEVFAQTRSWSYVQRASIIVTAT